MSKIKMFLVAGVEMWFKKNNANLSLKNRQTLIMRKS